MKFDWARNTAQNGSKFTGITFVCLPDRIGYHPNEFTPILSSISCPVEFEIQPVEFDWARNTAQNGSKFTGITFVCLPDRIGYHPNEFTPILSSISCPVKFDWARNTAQNGSKFTGITFVCLPDRIGYHPNEFTPILSSISCPVEFDWARNTAQNGSKFTGITFVCLPDRIGYHPNEFTPILSSISCPVEFEI